ncbi:MAG: fluoride efflux transporter CrcB [Planctomycetota bacterium]
MTMEGFLAKALLVFGGAGMGGVLRYAVGAWVQRRARGLFPWGTFVVNVTGCFAMGALMSFFEARDGLAPGARVFLANGLLGGYTTFSTYGYEAEQLLNEREGKLFLAYAGGSILAGLAGVWAGRLAAGAWRAL